MDDTNGSSLSLQFHQQQPRSVNGEWCWNGVPTRMDAPFSPRVFRERFNDVSETAPMVCAKLMIPVSVSKFSRIDSFSSSNARCCAGRDWDWLNASISRRVDGDGSLDDGWSESSGRWKVDPVNPLAKRGDLLGPYSFEIGGKESVLFKGLRWDEALDRNESGTDCIICPIALTPSAVIAHRVKSRAASVCWPSDFSVRPIWFPSDFSYPPLDRSKHVKRGKHTRICCRNDSNRTWRSWIESSDEPRKEDQFRKAAMSSGGESKLIEEFEEDDTTADEAESNLGDRSGWEGVIWIFGNVKVWLFGNTSIGLLRVFVKVVGVGRDDIGSDSRKCWIKSWL